MLRAEIGELSRRIKAVTCEKVIKKEPIFAVARAIISLRVS